MMGTSAAVVLVSLFTIAGGFELLPAPDQPLPHFYLDEPLVLQVVSDTNAQVEARAVVTTPAGEEIVARLGAMAFVAGKPRWATVPDLPELRGMFEVEMVLSGESGETVLKGRVPRVSRPFTEGTIPLALTASSLDTFDRMVLRGAPVREAWIVSGGEKMLAATTAEWESGAREAGVAAPLLAGTLEEVENRLRHTGIAAGRTALMVDGMWDRWQACVAVEDAFSAAGYEEFGFGARLVDAGIGEEGAIFAQCLLRVLAAGAHWVAMPYETMRVDDRFTEAYPVVNGLTPLLLDTRGVGRFTPSGHVEAYVLWRGDHWLLAYWTTGEAPVALALPKGTGVRGHWNALGNALPLPEAAEAGVVLEVMGMPRILEGEGITMPGMMAGDHARALAGALASQKEVMAVIEEEAKGAVLKVRDGPLEKVTRRQFFALLEQLPALEEEWHLGNVEGRIAAPTIAQITAMCGWIALSDEAEGRPFVERFEDILVKCGEFSRVSRERFTAVPEEAFQRGTAVVGVVDALLARAQFAHDAGRATESVGLATVAEWRARSLEYTVSAVPLAQPVAEVEAVTEEKPSAETGS